LYEIEFDRRFYQLLVSVLLWGAIGVTLGALVMAVIEYSLVSSTTITPVIVTKSTSPPEPADKGQTKELKKVASLNILQSEKPDAPSQTPGEGRARPSNQTTQADSPSARSQYEVQKMSEKKLQKKPNVTSLPLNLIGTLTGWYNNLAVVRHKKKKERKVLSTYERWSNFSIRSVAKDYLDIWNFDKSRLERLYMNPKKNKNKNDTSQNNNRAKKQEQESDDEYVQTVSRYQVNQAVHQNLNNMLAAVQPSPVVRNGNIIGFAIQSLEGRPGDLARAIGFMEGDIIRRVNGHKIDSLDKAYSLWEKLRNQSRFRILIERDGTTKEMNYELTGE